MRSANPVMAISSHKTSYRPEIDGLRAIAVLLVVFYHFGLGVPGGFIGVDVFFVISGFLITSLIWSELRDGRFSLATFWERRIRRIIPALIVVDFAVLLAGIVLLLPSDLTMVGRSAIWQSFFGANVFFWRSLGYFAQPAEIQPLLHTWSLAVEEQFYLVVPIALLVLFRWEPLRKRRVVVPILIFALVVSLCLSVYGVSHHPRAAFYLLPFRAWELLIGSILALAPTIPSARSVREGLSVIGLAMICAPAALYVKETSFPGLAALPPCLGTAFVIWSNSQSPTVVGRFLSQRPIVFMGLISYSLYLWHWPFLAFTKYWALGPIPISGSFGLLAIVFVLAVASWRFVETPIRRRSFLPNRKSVFALGGALLCCLFLSGAWLNSTQGLPTRFSQKVLANANAVNDRPFLQELTPEDIIEERFIRIGRDGAPIRMLVWGDSHALAMLPAFDELCKERGFAGIAATHSSTHPVLDFYIETEFGLGKASIEFNNLVFEYAKKKRIQDVVLVGSWDTSDFAPLAGKPLGIALKKTVTKLIAAGCQPWVVIDVPRQGFDVPRALMRSAILRENLDSERTKTGNWGGYPGTDPRIIDELRLLGAKMIDPRPGFLDASGEYFILEKDGVSLYADHHHLTGRGAKNVILPILEDSWPK